MTDAVDITTSQRKTILGLLKRYLPNVKVWAYGSRVKWRSRPESDLDMVVFTSPDQKREVSDLKEALEESNLPFRVDVFIWDEVPEGFRKNIDAEHVVLQERQEQRVANEWRQSTWGEEISLEYGKAIRGYKDAEGPYRVYGTNGPVGWTFEPLAPGPGVILGSKRAYRWVEYSKDPFFVIDTAYYVKPKTNLHMRWLYYAIKHYNLGEIDDGSPIPSTTRAAVYVRDVKIPSFEDQRAIAHILGSLDDKIELNRQMNCTLEKMAQAIFKSWFIDFDPVRAKAEGRDPGLPKEVADLFPDSFEESELGEIPKGWTPRVVSTLLDINPRLALSKGTVARYVDMKALPTSGFSVTAVIEKEFKGGAKFQQHDVLLARITPCLENGKTGLVDFLDGEEVGFGSTEFIVLRGRNGITKEFVYCLARDDQYRRHCISSMVGSSGRQRVQNACFDHFVLAEASESILTAFSERVRPVFEKITENSLESVMLSKLRDTLLPEMISGELPIPDAEKILEGVE
ncbi:MAG: restriction endonuclease subunit S [Candidatus Zixiibacteriota bacterium]